MTRSPDSARLIILAALFFIPIGLGSAVSGCGRAGVQQADRDAGIVKDFSDRAGRYVALHQQFEEQLPQLVPSDQPQAIAAHREALAELIQGARGGAKQGDIFSPEVAALFRQLIQTALEGRDTVELLESIREDNELTIELRVNAAYPEGAGLSRMPPAVLRSLPRLPEHLEYRFVDRHLILRDVDANLMVDFIRDAF